MTPALRMPVQRISPSTLRETCRILGAESLIQVERGTSGGIRVRRPDRGVLSRYASLLLEYQQTTLRDVYEYRILVEPAVAQGEQAGQGVDYTVLAADLKVGANEGGAETVAELHGVT